MYGNVSALSLLRGSKYKRKDSIKGGRFEFSKKRSKYKVIDHNSPKLNHFLNSKNIIICVPCKIEFI